MCTLLRRYTATFIHSYVCTQLRRYVLLCIHKTNFTPIQDIRYYRLLEFWQVGNQMNVAPTELTDPKVDTCELEVMLSAAALTDSQCAAELDKREPGRAAFIQRQIREGMRPLLRSVHQA